MSDNTLISASTDQVSCALDGDTVILNLKNSKYYELNPVAARVWELIGIPKTMADVRRTIVGEYDVTEERAREDIDRLLAELKSHELLVIHDE